MAVELVVSWWQVLVLVKSSGRIATVSSVVQLFAVVELPRSANPTSP